MPAERSEPVSETEYVDAARIVQAEIDAKGGLTIYFKHQASKTSPRYRAFLYRVAQQIATADEIVEPSEAEKDIPKHAILIGAMAGLAIVKTAYQPYVLNTSELLIELDDSTSDMEPDERMDVAQDWRDFGWQAMRIVGEPTNNKLEEWEDVLIDEVRYRSLFRVGAGIIIHSASIYFEELLKSEHEEELSKMAEEIENTGGDWDTALKELLG